MIYDLRYSDALNVLNVIDNIFQSGIFIDIDIYIK